METELLQKSLEQGLIPGIIILVWLIVNKIIEITGSKSEIKYNTKAEREFETENWTSDISKAKKKFSWELNNSFDEGIKKAVDWFQNNKNLYK